MAKLTKNAITILERRYLKKVNGKVAETPEDMFRRVAEVVASVEKQYGKTDEEITVLADEYFRMMSELEFLPNSPTLMNAGRELGQLSACFVLPVEDSIEGIFDSIKNAALIHQSGGGTGFSFSRLRPKGATVRSTGGVASGPVSFMKVFNSATEAIKQGGTRRGANMGILRVDHPDIMEFIKCKENNNDLTNFNISVGLTEKFMAAVERDEEYDLVNPQNKEVVQRLRAREVFDLIVDHAWRNGEPGIIFLDRLNRDNPTPKLGEIEATNPCVTADTWVATAEGPRQVQQLIGCSFTALINGQPYNSGREGFFKTGHKPVVRLTTKEGFSLRLTADHKVLRIATKTRYRLATEWVAAGDLKPGDKIALHDHRTVSDWHGALTEQEGYLLGMLLGDGVLKEEGAILSVWTKAAGGDTEQNGAAAMMLNAEQYAKALPHRADFVGWAAVAGREEHRLKSAALRDLAFQLGMKPGSKNITPALEQASAAAYRGFLRGLFDCGGSVQGGTKKGVSVRLAQSDRQTLEAVQRMLLRLGIKSAIYIRRPAGSRMLPDGKGGQKEYSVKEQLELIISGENLLVFADRIGFTDTAKATKLSRLLAAYRSRLNREWFLAEVAAVTADGEEEVYDVQVPGVNAFDANGLYVHNCGEQPLLPMEACNLGSLNLKLMVKKTDGRYTVDWDKLSHVVRYAVRFLDDVIDANKYPLPEIDKMAKGNRKIGLGVMGLADLLILLGIPYNTMEAVDTTREIMQFIQTEGRKESMTLAAERGVFPNYPGSIYDGKMELRNATITTVAPTGTISMIAGASSGVEPIFAVAYTKTVMDGTELVEVNPLFEEIARERGFYSEELMKEIARRGTVKGVPGVPEDVQRVFVTAQEISPEWHIRVQAAVQEYTDNAVSKTINFPHEATREDVAEAYFLAYRLGCKGLTVYRDGSRETQVLTTGTKEKTAEKTAGTGNASVCVQQPVKEGTVKQKIVPRSRPEITTGITKKIKIGCGNLYVSVNADGEGICEVFTNTGRAGGCASQSEATSRLVSIALRSGISVDTIVEQLAGIRCPACIRREGVRVTSCPDAIARVIKEFNGDGQKLIKMLAGEDEKCAAAEEAAVFHEDVPVRHSETPPRTEGKNTCPECGAHLNHESGCVVCTSCGYSKCG